MVAYVSTPVWSLVIGPPEAPIVLGSCRVRSSLIRSQLWPPLCVRQTRCVPVYRRSGSWWSKTIGYVHCERSSISTDDHPIGLSGQTLTVRSSPVL